MVIIGDDYMKILVAGGAGFIGSHTVVELLNNNYEVVIIDNFSNSKPKALKSITKITNKNYAFYEGDVCDYEFLNSVFEKEKHGPPTELIPSTEPCFFS